MLQHIQIRNLVIVRELALDLLPGMTALTGETGAGKSILVDALGLALGGKADKGMIRSGCTQAEINAVFDIGRHKAVQHWLNEQALDSDDECILRRVLSRQGRSRAFINGRPAPLALLSELGSLLLSIHGQHEHQTLMRSATQRELLDAWAGHARLVKTMKDRYREFRATRQQLQDLQQQARERTQRLDYLQFQIDELEKLGLAVEELEQLEIRQKRLAHAEELGRELGSLVQTLFEDEQALQPALAQACVRLEALGRLDENLQPANELLDSARIQLEEAVSLLREQAAGIELDPASLAEIDTRLGSIHELARKHHVNARELPELLEQLQQEKTSLDNADRTLVSLEKQVQTLESRCREAADKLSRSRTRAAQKLADTITASMQELGMQGGVFGVEITPLEQEEITAQGADRICFMVSANPGQPMTPLAGTASGGELSRISLAIQVATTRFSETPTLIFDEVDSGIGGATAETVGRLLRQLGEAGQVLCVTHLPQVASQAHQQLRVSKQTDGRSTETTILALDEKQRVEEIARMLGGARITPQTRAHAREMIG
jgi:DNA repair protein RecN (Recombination protein N)